MTGVFRIHSGRGLVLLALACQHEGATPPASQASSSSETSEPGVVADGSGVHHARSQQAEALARRFAGAPALKVFVGKASYYSDRLAGKGTASGEPYDPSSFTAAHRSLPFGSIVRVTRTDVGRTTYVKINDRGPFGARGRVLDVSRAAAAELDMLEQGVVSVRAELVQSAH